MQHHTRSRLVLVTWAFTLDNRGCKIREEVSREIPTWEFELSNQLILEWLVAAVSNISLCESHASCESQPCLEAFTCKWHHFPNVRNHNAVYAQRCLLIWFIVCLSFYSVKIPQAAFYHFFAKKRVTPTIRCAFLWSLWKLRGTPREYPLVSGSWLNLTWQLFESKRSKYSNRAVMYSNRIVMVTFFLKL